MVKLCGCPHSCHHHLMQPVQRARLYHLTLPGLHYRFFTDSTPFCSFGKLYVQYTLPHNGIFPSLVQSQNIPLKIFKQIFGSPYLLNLSPSLQQFKSTSSPPTWKYFDGNTLESCLSTPPTILNKRGLLGSSE